MSRGEQGAKVEGQRWAPFVKETSYARHHRYYLGIVIDFVKYSSYQLLASGFEQYALTCK